ncbi:MAG: hypothetical protein ACRERD_20080, partial [Candidatus Binatia bacterium]
MRKLVVVVMAALAVLLLLPNAQAGLVAAAPTTTVELTSDLPSGQPVGTTIVWTVSTDSPDPADFRLRVSRSGEPLRVMYDFRLDNTFEWTPIEDGLYTVVGTARNTLTGETIEAVRQFVILPRSVQDPIISATNHPLVALYSAPACPAGYTMRVVFKLVTEPRLSATNHKPCQQAHSTILYIAGMRERSLYAMFHEIRDADGTPVSYGPTRYFRTGQIEIDMFDRTLLNQPGPAVSFVDNLILWQPVIGTPAVWPNTVVTDLYGRPVWYDDTSNGNPNSLVSLLVRPVEGGTFLLLAPDEGLDGQFLREIDLAGNTVQETNIGRIREQIVPTNPAEYIGSIHHEARRLPNGHTAIIAS